MASYSFAEIKATAPPPEFSELWKSDVQAWHIDGDGDYETTFAAVQLFADLPVIIGEECDVHLCASRRLPSRPSPSKPRQPTARAAGLYVP